MKRVRIFALVILSALLCFLVLNDPSLTSLETSAILDGHCIKDCMENPWLIDHIQNTMDQPSGKSPILVNPNRNQEGQSGQVTTILKHFKNKVSFLIDL